MSDIANIGLWLLAFYGAMSLGRDIRLTVEMERMRRRALRAVKRWEELNGRRP